VHRPTLVLAAGLVLAAAGALTACHTGETGAASDPAPSVSSVADTDAFPVTIKTSFGPVTLTEQPTRIVALGTNDTDNLLSLGVVPVGMTKVSWGGNARGSDPWTDAGLKKLGASLPTLLDDTDGVPMDAIAALNPDVILATNYGLTKQQYQTLTKIAPVVAYPGAAWTTTWQDSLRMDGEATGLTAQADTVARQTQAELDKAKADYPQLQGRTFIWSALSATDLSSIAYYTPTDSRPMLLTSLGMRNAPIITRLAKPGQFYGSISAERATDLVSDVLISYVTKPSDATTYEKDRLVGRIPAIAAGHLAVFPEGFAAEAGTVTTPLSIPYAIAHFVPKIAAAVS
jgi:iron complex transport system substrate-binding protein